VIQEQGGKARRLQTIAEDGIATVDQVKAVGGTDRQVRRAVIVSVAYRERFGLEVAAGGAQDLPRPDLDSIGVEACGASINDGDSTRIARRLGDEIILSVAVEIGGSKGRSEWEIGLCTVMKSEGCFRSGIGHATQRDPRSCRKARRSPLH